MPLVQVRTPPPSLPTYPTTCTTPPTHPTRPLPSCYMPLPPFFLSFFVGLPATLTPYCLFPSPSILQMVCITYPSTIHCGTIPHLPLLGGRTWFLDRTGQDGGDLVLPRQDYRRTHTHTARACLPPACLALCHSSPAMPCLQQPACLLLLHHPNLCLPATTTCPLTLG